jgi:AhpD family alkylhydroperoxidase
MSTTPRLNVHVVAPGAIHAMLQLSHYVTGLGLEPKLYELVKIRASQINGCAHCIDMHTMEARAIGET